MGGRPRAERSRGGGGFPRPPRKARGAPCVCCPSARRRPMSSCPTRRCARAAASHSALEAVLAPRKIPGVATPLACPVGPPLRWCASRGRSPAALAAASTPAPSTSTCPPRAGGLPLEQQTLHLLQLLLLLPGERAEKGGNTPIVAATSTAAAPSSSTASIVASSAPHAATVVAGQDAAGRFNGQKAAGRLPEAALPPVPGLFPRGAGGRRPRREPRAAPRRHEAGHKPRPQARRRRPRGRRGAAAQEAAATARRQPAPQARSNAPRSSTAQQKAPSGRRVARHTSCQRECLPAHTRENPRFPQQGR